MRFVCDRCKSKYSISDEKVRGKILKIRCKRCGNVVEVRDPASRAPTAAASAPPQTPIPIGAQSYHFALGSQESGDLAAGIDAPPTRSNPLGDDLPSVEDSYPGHELEERTQISGPGLLDELRRTAAGLSAQPGFEPALSEWYVSVGDQPTGPVTREQIRGYVTAGKVTSESLCWREGYGDWIPLARCPELADLLRSGSRSMRPVAPPPVPSPRRDTSSSRRLPQASSPAARSPLSGRGLPAPSPAPPPPGLRGQQVGRLGAPSQPLPGQSAAPSVSAAMAPSPDVAPPTDPEVPLFVPDEGPSVDLEPSGSFGPPTDLTAAPQMAGESSSQGLFGAAGEDSALLTPVPLSPSEFPEKRGQRSLVWVVAGIGAVTLGVVGALLFLQSGNNQSQAATSEAAAAPAQEPAKAGVVGGASDRLEFPAANAEQDGEGTVEEEEGTEAVTQGGSKRRAKRSRRTKATKEPTQQNLSAEDQRQLALAKSMSESLAPAATPRKGRGSSSAARGGRPLSGEQIRSTIGRNRASIQRCYEREMRRTSRSGDLRVVIRLTVQPSGIVSSARVSPSQVRGSSLGTCIMGAARRWRFPSATASSTVEAPFVLTSGSR
jgi:predicted Zn finger-like uncharacterized protein